MSHSTQRCGNCGVVCTGQLCQPCRYDAMRKPLGECLGCGALLHRRKTPIEDRPEGSRLLNSHSRCGACVKIAIKEGLITKGTRERTPSTPPTRQYGAPPAATLTYDEQQDALCSQTDPEIFFPEVGAFSDSRTARQVCAQCPIRARCLEVAMENNEEFGIFGGLTSHERKDLRRARRANEVTTLREFWDMTAGVA